MAQKICKWPISSFQKSEFDVFSLNTDWNDVGGIYIFCYLGEEYWHALYIGQADSFKNRLSGHDRLDEAKRKGATHIHARTVAQQAQRNALEKQLIEYMQPTMNTQNK